MPISWGVEYLSFVGPGNARVAYSITVLDLVDNGFAVEDRAYTLVDKAITVNVISNDLYQSFTSCISYGSPMFGSLQPGPVAGRIVYTPPVGWSGVDRFTYTSFPPGCAGRSETETVYVVVGNFEPESTTVDLTTTEGAAIPLTYLAPAGNASWQLTTPPSRGTVTNSNGQLVYTPNGSTGTDQLVVTYCLLNPGNAGGCSFSKSVTVNLTIHPGNGLDDCTTDCVWPGDTNKDGVVDIADLIPIGLYMGSTGTPRPNGDPSRWCAQQSENWPQTDNGVNRKHVDASGDQIISSADTQVVRDNLGLAHRIRTQAANLSLFDLYLEGDIFYEPGDLVRLDIVAGQDFVVIEDVNGFILPFPFDPTVISPTTVEINFNEDSWFSYDSPIISMQSMRSNALGSSVEAAVVRTNGRSTSGYGPIGSLDFVVIEDVNGFRDTPGETVITLGGATAEVINSHGNPDGVRVQPFDIVVRNTPQ
ncbi:MAG: hypothetical protein HC821_03830, partial [Lewinella sp.]|nr:hypothetical protein [Lewinella sp.]